MGTLKVTEKVGALVGILEASDSEDLIVINRSGILLRTPVDTISVIGRNTQGVRVINIREGDAISSVTTVTQEEEIADPAASAVTDGGTHSDEPGAINPVSPDPEA